MGGDALNNPFSLPPGLVAVWLSGNVVGHINEVTLHQAGLMLRWVTVRGVYRLGVQPSDPGQLSLVIPPWVGKMSTSDGYGYRLGRNGEFCVTEGPVTTTAGIQT